MAPQTLLIFVHFVDLSAEAKVKQTCGTGVGVGVGVVEAPAIEGHVPAVKEAVAETEQA